MTTNSAELVEEVADAKPPLETRARPPLRHPTDEDWRDQSRVRWDWQVETQDPRAAQMKVGAP